MAFPVHRPRRLRSSAAVRGLVRETTISPAHLIQPLFVHETGRPRTAIASMPGVFRLSRKEAVKEARALVKEGVNAVMLFGLPNKKDPRGTGAFAQDGVIQSAVADLKAALPNLLVMTDLCLCEYTDHGHCGVLKKTLSNVVVDNDATLEVLAQVALSQAKAGADWVAPSGMMDGAVGTLRCALDGEGFSNTAILSYAVKYASAFYGPFREAVQSSPSFGDRRSHQMDPANAGEALREAASDIAEGADMIMVKPALAYLDIIHRLKSRFDVPVAAYNVSGEYALVKAASQNGWVDEAQIVNEILLSIRRAGADVVITYHALATARAFSQK